MNITKLFFNPHTNDCEYFAYSGCGGNANNFMSVRECESKCKKKSQVPFGSEPSISKESDHSNVAIVKHSEILPNNTATENNSKQISSSKTFNEKRTLSVENVKTVQFGIIELFDDVVNQNQEPKYTKMTGEIDKTVSDYYIYICVRVCVRVRVFVVVF